MTQNPDQGRALREGAEPRRLHFRAWQEELPCSLTRTPAGALAVQVERAFTLEGGARIDFRIGPGGASATVLHPSMLGRWLSALRARREGRRGVELELEEPRLYMGDKPVGRG